MQLADTKLFQLFLYLATMVDHRGYTITRAAQHWLGVFDGAVDDLERVDGISAFIGAVNSGVDDTLGEGAFAVFHHLGDQATDNLAVELRILVNFGWVDSFSACHGIGWSEIKLGKLLLSARFRLLGTVFGTALLTTIDPEGIE